MVGGEVGTRHEPGIQGVVGAEFFVVERRQGVVTRYSLPTCPPRRQARRFGGHGGGVSLVGGTYAAGDGRYSTVATYSFANRVTLYEEIMGNA